MEILPSKEAVVLRKYRQVYLALIFTFILGVHKGKLALYKPGCQDPLRVFPYRVEMLPAADQAALEKGIPINTPDGLSRLIEDYLS